MMGKAKGEFIKEYNQRLFNWLVVSSLVMVVVGRFIMKMVLMEVGAWLVFVFLELYTRIFWSSDSLYFNPLWHFIVSSWEFLVYNPFFDLDRWAVPAGIAVAILALYCKCSSHRRSSHNSMLLPLYNPRTSTGAVFTTHTRSD